MNKQLQEKYNRSQHLLSENEELKHSLKTMKLQNSYGTPQREDISEGIMGSIAQHFRGQGNSSRDQDIVNSLFKGFQN